jgi:hypothetical protein
LGDLVERRFGSLGSMNECSAISDLPASMPSMKSTSHFGGNDGDEPGLSCKDEACRRGALESSIAPHVPAVTGALDWLLPPQPLNRELELPSDPKSSGIGPDRDLKKTQP